jgi:hypothetical protein
MRLRRLRWLAALVFALAAQGGLAHAQYGYIYPGGYGGWGGWGATTVGGDWARGMGVFAAGVGQYNVNTAQAAAINAQTVMQFNEYLWESQQIRNQRYYEQQQARRTRNIQSRETIMKRLIENPTTDDIISGDALNVALDQVTSPKVYVDAMKEAQVAIPSSLIKQIPFNAASEAITISLAELTDRENWPAEIIQNPAFEEERANLRAAAEEARKEDDEGELKPETLRKLRDAVAALRAKVEATYQPGTQERRRVTPHLRALSGLVRMLDQPRVRDLLKNVDDTDERPLADLLGFMHTFNLRFGVAETPDQRVAYQQLWPALDNLRDALKGVPSPMAVTPTPGRAGRAPAFFQNLPEEHLNTTRPVPSVPEFKPAPAPPEPKP